MNLGDKKKKRKEKKKIPIYRMANRKRPSYSPYILVHLSSKGCHTKHPT
jgi:hypothetical protein